MAGIQKIVGSVMKNVTGEISPTKESKFKDDLYNFLRSYGLNIEDSELKSIFDWFFFHREFVINHWQLNKWIRNKLI